METQSNDRRRERTRQALRGALIELIIEKHYETISVQDIIDRANVGRSTFYTHFRDKEDLFRGDWQRVIEYFADGLTAENLSNGKVFPLSALFHHLKDFHHLYRALVRSGMIEKVFALGQKHLAERLENRLEQMPSDAFDQNIPLPLLANYLATEIFAHLKWWLDRQMPYTPERMDEIFHRLVLQGITFDYSSK